MLTLVRTCFVRGKGQNVENHFIECQKKNIESQKRTSKIRTSKVSIKRIRTSKDQNDDNYLWRSTYGYQGLWGVRLGSVWLGLVRIG